MGVKEMLGFVPRADHENIPAVCELHYKLFESSSVSIFRLAGRLSLLYHLSHSVWAINRSLLVLFSSARMRSLRNAKSLPIVCLSRFQFPYIEQWNASIYSCKNVHHKGLSPPSASAPALLRHDPEFSGVVERLARSNDSICCQIPYELKRLRTPVRYAW